MVESPRSFTAAGIHSLQRDAGNRAVAALLDSPVQRAPSPGGDQSSVVEPEPPAPKQPDKEMIDRAQSIKVLQDAFKGYVTTISGGKVELLGQADFQAAWDKIYGETKYAWDTYIKPGPGNLEGFALKNVNYINKDVGSVDVVPHEMLHNNDHSGWTPFAGSETNEGVTEYLTIKAVTAAGYTASHSYRSQEGVIQELVKVTSEDLLMNAYFKGETGALKTKMESSCKGTWAQFKVAMQAKQWAKAKAFLGPKGGG
jgi:hypothetical protein